MQRASEKGRGGGECERTERNLGIHGVRQSQGTVSELLVRDGFCQRRVLRTGSGMERRQNRLSVSSSGSWEDRATLTCDPP